VASAARVSPFPVLAREEEDVERSASSTLSSPHIKAGMIWLSESDRDMEM
jgi:hypothetical protein